MSGPPQTRERRRGIGTLVGMVVLVAFAVAAPLVVSAAIEPREGSIADRHPELAMDVGWLVPVVVLVILLFFLPVIMTLVIDARTARDEDGR